MSYFNHFELVQNKNIKGEYELIIFLDDFTTEFGNEFGVKTDSNDNLLDSTKRLIATHYPELKVTMVRVIVSGLVFATFPIATLMASAKSTNVLQESVQSKEETIHSPHSLNENPKTLAPKLGNSWLKISPNNQFAKLKEEPQNSSSFLIHRVVSGDTIWDIGVKYGIPQTELFKVNSLKLDSPLYIGQQVKVPQYQIAIKETVSSRHGEHLDWWEEAQYVIPIGKTFKVTDFATGKSFMVKRTIGANHADSETVTAKDSVIAKGIWNGFSWKERPVIIEVDDRKIAASMSFMPHDIEFIKDNGINGHFDIHFKNSTRHKDGKVDHDHQKQVNIAAGVQAE
jgi:LysM repeat protein